MGLILVIAVIFSGLALMPYLEMMNPKSMPRGMPKTHFSGLSLMFFCLKALEHNVEVVNQIDDPLGFDNDVVNVSLAGGSDVLLENMLHASLVRRTCVP
jgi:hypothetical protein